MPRVGRVAMASVLLLRRKPATKASVGIVAPRHFVALAATTVPAMTLPGVSIANAPAGGCGCLEARGNGPSAEGAG